MKKLIQSILLSLLLLASGVATAQAQTSLTVLPETIQTTRSRRIRGAQVQVFNAGTCSPATITQYSPQWPVSGNTVLTDAAGQFVFVGSATAYDLRFSGGSIPKAFHLRWISNKSGIYNVKDFGATGDATTDDTRGISSAIAFIGSHNGGKLLFPGGYYKVGNPLGQCDDGAPAFDGFTLPSGITIEGTNGGSFSNCLVELIGEGKNLFKIGQSTNRVTFQDIKLRATSTTGTVAILATGPTATATNPNSDLGFVFSRIWVEGFDKGIYVLGSDPARGWQFDLVKLQDSFIIGNRVGILIDTFNTDWQISNTAIGVVPGGVAVQVEHIGALTIHNLFGGGGALAAGPGVPYPNPATAAKAFIWIRGPHAGINIQDSECENTLHAFLYDFDNTTFNWANDPEVPTLRPPVAFHNNLFGDRVTLRANVVLVSTGNYYNSDTVRTVRSPGSDNDGSGGVFPGSYNSQIYSFGDQFTYRTSTNKDCPPMTLGFDTANEADCRRDFYLDNSQGGMNSVVTRSGVAAVESLTAADRRKSRNLTSFQSAIRISSPPTDNAGTSWGYTIQRNTTSGFLDFLGNQKPPTFPYGSYVGFQFNGHLYPTEDAQYELGNGTKRWSLVRGVTVVSGDTILSDKITGKELYRIREDERNIYFEDLRTGKQMMRLDRNGNLFVVGRIHQRSPPVGQNPQSPAARNKARKGSRNRKHQGVARSNHKH